MVELLVRDEPIVAHSDQEEQYAEHNPRAKSHPRRRRHERRHSWNGQKHDEPDRHDHSRRREKPRPSIPCPLRALADQDVRSQARVGVTERGTECRHVHDPQEGLPAEPRRQERDDGDERDRKMRRPVFGMDLRKETRQQLRAGHTEQKPAAREVESVDSGKDRSADGNAENREAGRAETSPNRRSGQPR